MNRLLPSINRQIFRFICIISFAACCTTKQVAEFNILGEFVEPDYGHELIFNKTEFVHKSSPQTHIGIYSCCDTISYGTWELDKNLARLSTRYASPISFELTAVGKIMPGDSIAFGIRSIVNRLITNPFNQGSEFDFILVTYDRNGMDIGSRKASMKDSLVYFPTQRHKIGKVSLRILPSGEYWGRFREISAVDTRDLVLKEQSSNYFELDIPKITYSYFTFRRLESDFVKIVDNKTLEWNGRFYKKVNK